MSRAVHLSYRVTPNTDALPPLELMLLLLLLLAGWLVLHLLSFSPVGIVIYGVAVITVVLCVVFTFFLLLLLAVAPLWIHLGRYYTNERCT